MLAHMHPSRWRFAYGSRLVNGTAAPAQCPRPGPSPPGAQSPFARGGCYPVRRDVRHHVGRHYPSFIAHTGSCVRPSPSPRFRVYPYTAGLCRLSPVPAGKWPFPALSPQSLCGCSDPYHAAPLRCTRSFLREGHRPHPRDNGFGTPSTRRNATSTARDLSRLQSFRYVRAPTLARPPDCTHRRSLLRGGRAVYTTQWTGGYPLEPWYRYVPESSNWHGGTFTRWIAALPAAPYPPSFSYLLRAFSAFSAVNNQNCGQPRG